MTTNPTTNYTAAHRALTYETTRWQRYLYDRRVVGGDLRDAVRLAGEAAAKGADATGAAGARVDAADFAGEVFARLYNDPARLDAPSAEVPWATAVHDAIDGLPEWAALREAVAGDPDMSALAAAEVITAIAPRVSDAKDEAERKAARNGGGPENRENGAPVPSGMTDAQGARIRSAARRAIAAATSKVAEAREALAGLAPGLEASPPTHEQADPARLTLAERLLRDPQIRDVLRRAGRLARLAKDTRKVRDTDARSEVVDLERGSDLARILPSQLARLRHPTMRRLALRDILERSALQYRLEGKEPQGRGPVIVCLDRSGSMSGEGETWASATAIAIMGAATREGRRVTVVEFTAGVDTVVRVAKGRGVYLDRHNPSREIGDAGDVAAVALRLASRRSNGGTDFGPVLRYALAAGVLDDRADFVFVTDGQADADAATLDALREARTRGLRVFGLTVNGGTMTSAIKAIADVAIDLDGVEDVAEAIARAMPR